MQLNIFNQSQTEGILIGDTHPGAQAGTGAQPNRTPQTGSGGFVHTGN
jgi:hypothetical protein